MVETRDHRPNVSQSALSLPIPEELTNAVSHINSNLGDVHVTDAEEMDERIDSHFAREGSDDVNGVLATLDADALHDVVGSPLGLRRGREAARPFYGGCVPICLKAKLRR